MNISFWLLCVAVACNLLLVCCVNRLRRKVRKLEYHLRAEKRERKAADRETDRIQGLYSRTLLLVKEYQIKMGNSIKQ